MSALGANTIRILPFVYHNPPTGEPKCSLGDVEDLIKRAINGKMMVDVAIDGGRDVQSFLKPEMVDLLKKYEKYIVLHAKGESFENSEDEWVTASKHVITVLRAAGYTCPLYILPTLYGRDLKVVLKRGQEIVNHDPLKNIIMGWQAYWGLPGGHYQNLQGMSLSQGFTAVGNANFPIQVGLMYHSDPYVDGSQLIPYEQCMADAQRLGIGWLWWDWQLDVDGYGSPAGRDAIELDANSIKNTSVRTPFLLNGSV